MVEQRPQILEVEVSAFFQKLVSCNKEEECGIRIELVTALPGMGSILLLLCLIFYVFSVMAAKLFGGTNPEQLFAAGWSAWPAA